MVGGSAAAVLLVLVGGWWLLAGRDGGDDDNTDIAQPQQQTLLIQVAAPDGTARTSALLGVQPDGKQASAVLVPSGLIVEIPGSGAVPFGETLGLPDVQAPGKALTDLLGVSVDGSWVLTQAGLATLVDAVGGIPAEVDVDVVGVDAKGEETVAVRAGSQQLGGAAAVAYGTYSAPDEPEQARLARFNDVLDGVLRGLSAQPAQVERVLGSLADQSRSTLDRDELADIVVGARTVAAAGDLVTEVLPVNPIESGGTTETYGINPQPAAALMQSRFAASLVRKPGSDEVRVLVQNGVGTPGLVDKARSKLVAAGFRFVNGGNAPEFSKAATVVLIPDSTQESVGRGAAVATALRLPAEAVQRSGQGQSVAEVIVVLGSDFRP